MTTIIQKLSLVLTTLMLGIGLHISGQDLNEQLEHIFDPLDKSRVTTGLLFERGIFLSDSRSFTGIPTDSSYVSKRVLLNLYSGVYSSIVSPALNMVTTSRYFELMNGFSRESSPNEVTIAMLCYTMNRVRSDASRLGLLAFSNGQLHDGNTSQTPYEDFQLFAAAPLKGKLYGNDALFKFPHELIMTNAIDDIQQIIVDPSDGKGFREVNPDVPLRVTYPKAGNAA